MEKWEEAIDGEIEKYIKEANFDVPLVITQIRLEVDELASVPKGSWGAFTLVMRKYLHVGDWRYVFDIRHNKLHRILMGSPHLMGSKKSSEEWLAYGEAAPAE